MKNLNSIVEFLNCEKGIKILDKTGYSVSFLMPCIENGYKAERVFFYANIPQIERSRPFAWASISSEHGMVLSFNYCAVCDFVDTNKYPLNSN